MEELDLLSNIERERLEHNVEALQNRGQIYDSGDEPCYRTSAFAAHTLALLGFNDSVIDDRFTKLRTFLNALRA